MGKPLEEPWKPSWKIYSYHSWKFKSGQSKWFPVSCPWNQSFKKVGPEILECLKLPRWKSAKQAGSEGQLGDQLPPHWGKKVCWPIYVSLDWPTASDRNRAKLMKNNMVSCRLSRKNHPNECLKRPSHLHLVQPTWSVLKAQEEAPAMRQQLLSSAQQVTFAESQTSMHLRIHITTLTTLYHLYLYYFWTKVLVFPKLCSRNWDTPGGRSHRSQRSCQTFLRPVGRQSIVGWESGWISRPKGIRLFPSSGSEWQQLEKNIQLRYVKIC